MVAVVLSCEWRDFLLTGDVLFLAFNTIGCAMVRHACETSVS